MNETILIAKEREGKAGGGKGIMANDRISYTLRVASEQMVVMYLGGTDSKASVTDGDIAPTVLARAGTGGGNEPIVLMKKMECSPKIICLNDMGGAVMNVSDKPGSLRAQMKHHEPIVCFQNSSGDNIATTLTASYSKGTGTRNGEEREYLAVCVGNGQTNQATGNVAGALNCMHDQQAVIHSDEQRKYILRRLTPIEYARLQGFPDWWCDGADGSDSAQYKLWGNGIALPCAADVIGRCAKALREESDSVEDGS